MSGVTKKLMSASGGAGGGFTAIEDVFSTYLYTGNGSTQTITNGIDLAGEGGLVWIKNRGNTAIHNLHDTERGIGTYLQTHLTSAEVTDADEVTAFNSNGFELGDGTKANSVDGSNYASWTFRKAPRFFDVVTYTGTGSARTINHNLGTTVGSIIIKRNDATSNWAVYHRGNTAAPETDFLSLNLTNATADDATYWNDTAPTDSVFTVGTNAAVNASGGTYVAYLYAHDPLGPSGDGSDGLIACGSYPRLAGYQVELGWEPQWVLLKEISGTGNWILLDSMRGLLASGNDAELYPNTSEVESVANNRIDINATGFSVPTGSGSATWVYIAIRRGPMRAPESGTEVYLPSTATGVVTTGFPVDLHIGATQAGLSTNHRFHDRLRGGTKELVSSSTAAETTVTDLLFDGNEGLRFSFGSGQVNHFFRRAPNFFDAVAYTGDGAAQNVSHNLGVVPELMIVKSRDLGTARNWCVYHTGTGNTKSSFLNLTNTPSTSINFWNNTNPSESVFSLGAADAVNTSGEDYITYLFATLPGVSKVGSYTGNGSSQTIDCGFTTGARLVLIKATSTTGDWLIADTARGIVSGNDPYLELNTTNAEVTSEDWLDPDSSGFVVNEVSGSNANTSGVSYIFYAVS